MKFYKLIFACFIVFCSSLSSMNKISDIQYCVDSGFDGTYPSSFSGKNVTVSGIVSKINENGSFYIQEKQSRPWSGILCADNRFSNKIKLNSEIKVTGTVSEIFGETCIKKIRDLSVISAYNEPVPIEITVNEMNTNEAYEGVFVSINADNTIIRNNCLYVDDGTGKCMVELPQSYINFIKKLGRGADISKISGVIVYNCGEFKLQPRSGKDFVSDSRNINNTSWGRVKSLYK
ncbi:MAG: hypothetical protein CSB55_07385 [Candidatus Cloacimonadota bacterium]|nr:MAG: hypothetical protein CSB55_07385 [Candidatus Cloacimonadota bacterium]